MAKNRLDQIESQITEYLVRTASDIHPIESGLHEVITESMGKILQPNISRFEVELEIQKIALAAKQEGIKLAVHHLFNDSSNEVGKLIPPATMIRLRGTPPQKD